MTLRGVYSNGTIVLGTEIDLPDGSPVRVDVTCIPSRGKSASGRGTTAKSRNTRTRTAAQRRVDAVMQGFGISADVPAWKGKTSAEIARELRQRALGDWGAPKGKRRG